MGERVCTCCRGTKGDHEFGVRKSGRVERTCKSCVREKTRLWSEKNPGRASRRAAKWNRDNADRRKVIANRWQSRNRWSSRNQSHLRRMFVRERNDGTVTPEFLKGLYAECFCAYCGSLTPPSRRTADHVVPFSRGGWHSANNMVMACEQCNKRKNDMTGEEFEKVQAHG